MNSILNIEVSCFANFYTKTNPKNINLLSWLKSNKYKDKVKFIRNIEDKAERDKIKATLPAITPSGLFSYCAKSDLIKHSGFIAIDIDPKGNEHIRNFTELKSHLRNIPNVAYCGLSVSGRGYWCLIPIVYVDKHELHFRALEEIFKSFGIKIDAACKDVSRLRGYSYDSEGYFNHHATPFNGIYKEPIKKYTSKKKIKIDENSNDKIGIAVNMIRNAPDGEKHNTLLKASKLMGGYIATGEVAEEKAIEEMENAIQSRNIDSLEAAKKTIQSGIAYGKRSPIYDYKIERALRVPVLVRKLLEPEPLQSFQTLAEDKQLEYIKPTYCFSKTEQPKPETWEYIITELETYYTGIQLPTKSIKLNSYSTITNVSVFIKSHLAIIKANNWKRTFLPYLDRLKELKNYLP